MKQVNLEQVLEMMEQETSNYGFRGASKHDLELVESGEYLDASLDTWEERDCPYDENADRLNGTSAISINEWMDIDELKNRFDYTMGYASNHHGTNVVLFVSGDNSEYGDDDREIVLKDDFEQGAKIIAQVIVA